MRWENSNIFEKRASDKWRYKRWKHKLLREIEFRRIFLELYSTHLFRIERPVVVVVVINIIIIYMIIVIDIITNTDRIIIACMMMMIVIVLIMLMKHHGGKHFANCFFLFNIKKQCLSFSNAIKKHGKQF